MRAKLVAGNWKMHGSFPDNAKLLDEVTSGTSQFSRSHQAVCVPFPYLGQVQQILASGRVAWGAQNVSQHEKGAYTGEVSASMLREFGCKYVIVGHSERRTLFGEDSETVALKYRAATTAGLTPILCVGETLAQREAGKTEDVVREQLEAVTAKFGVSSLVSGVVAYEPVWAIGTGKTATPDQAQSVHEFLRARVAAEDPSVAANLLILYGGSVKASNAAELFAMPDIDGGLIGGASLIAAEFLAISKAAEH
ncbi:MAG: triose-phosphate isomerase [Proteobacteria bacterium]|nr:MAG: triose-phosphate isomerase [Pseudomonadota bacterium]